MSQIILKVFTEGGGDCEHEWVYSQPSGLTFTIPLKAIQERICECCGRKEGLEVRESVCDFDNEKYLFTINRFNK